MASSAEVGARTTNSTGLRCDASARTRRKHFHGALLGLWSAPIAHPSNAHQWMTATLVDSFSLIQVFASDADAFRQPLSGILTAALGDFALADAASARLRLAPLPVWLVSVPMLLRYHDSRSLRLRWLDAQQPSLQAIAQANHLPWAVAMAQIIQLGDFLEMALSGWTPPLLDYVTELHTQRCAQSPSQEATTQVVCDNALKALGRTFGLSAEVLRALGSGFPLALLLAIPDEGEQRLLLGFLAGVLQGASQLPVLWQMAGCARAVYGSNPRGRVFSRAVTITMANRLFDQWAGIQPI